MKPHGILGPLSSVALCAGVFALSFAVARRASSQALEHERRIEERRRHQEALELHDSVVQGIAAGIWMLDADCKDGALEALTTTMGVAQHLVLELLGSGEIVPGSFVGPVNTTAA